MRTYLDGGLIFSHPMGMETEISAFTAPVDDILTLFVL